MVSVPIALEGVCLRSGMMSWNRKEGSCPRAEEKPCFPWAALGALLLFPFWQAQQRGTQQVLWLVPAGHSHDYLGSERSPLQQGSCPGQEVL